MCQKFSICCLIILVCLPSYISAQVPDYLNKIEDFDKFKQLAGEPLVSKYSNITSVKVIVRCRNSEVYFINSWFYKLHFDFVFKSLNEYSDLEQFNAVNYTDSKHRSYFLPNLNFDSYSNKYFIDFSAADNISIENICKVHQAIQQNFTITDSIFVLLSNPKILSNAHILRNKGIPVLSPVDIYNNQKLQVISEGNSCGKLVLFDKEKSQELYDYSSSILIVEGNTNDIPYCRGIISATLQTPLSHICILSRKRGIPAISRPFYKDDSLLNSLIDKFVCITVIKDSFCIIPNDITQIDANVVDIPKEIILKVDTLTRGIIDLANLSAKDIRTVGAKAANLAELQKIKRFSATFPEGACAIPISYYFDHIKIAGADSLINQLDNPLLKIDDCILLLIKIQRKILQTKVKSELIDSLDKKLRSYNAGINFRFRSSSNAEDRDFFSGAGLYDSKTAILGDSVKTIEKAIQKVWASLWSVRAFEERKYKNIDLKTVGMGILIHRSFPDEDANGVIITRNLYRNVPYGFVFNVQVGDESVVQPNDSIQCDQLISYYNLGTTMFNKPFSTEYITFSSLNNGIPVLTDEQIRFLTQQAELIKEHFYYRWDNWKKVEYKDFALDIEFKVNTDINGKQIIYIKQIRPF